MKNLKLRTKFIIAIVPVFLLVLVLLGLASYVSNSAKDKTEKALYDELYVASSNLINADRDFYQAYVAAIQTAFNAGDPVELAAERDENYHQTHDRVEAAMEAVASNEALFSEYTIDYLLVESGEQPLNEDHTGRTMKEIHEKFERDLESWNNAEGSDEAIFYFNEARESLNDLEDFMDVYAEYELQNIDSEVKAQLVTSIVVVLIISIAVIALLFYIIFTLLKGIRKVNANLGELANNNLSIEPDLVAGSDEIAEMSQGVLALRQSLLKAIGSVNDASEVLSNNIAQVSAGNARSTDGMTNINMAITEVADTSQHVASSAELLTAKTNEMGDAIEAIAGNIHELRSASDQISQINVEATKSMGNVLDSSEHSVSAVGDISVQINNTNEAVMRIEECIQVISDISAQTNLLSLNASIEAARAGEAGRGFAVVAEEIRNLADSSAQSAEQIRTIVGNVTEMSNKTVVLAEEVSAVISKQQEDVKYTQQKFEALTEAVEKSVSGINAIEDMSEGLEQIKLELTDATSTLSAISEELGASAQEVSATCSEVVDECEATNSMSVEMSGTKDSLIDAISVFKI